MDCNLPLVANTLVLSSTWNALEFDDTLCELLDSGFQANDNHPL